MNLVENHLWEKTASDSDGEGFLSTLPRPVIHLGPDGHIRAVNRAFLIESGYEPYEVVGNSILFFVHPDSQGHVADAFSKCLLGEDSFCTVDAIRKNGDVVRYNAINTPVWDGAGKVKSIFVVSWAVLKGECGISDSNGDCPRVCAVARERRQAVNLNECLRQVAQMARGDEILLSLSPRVPHTMADLGSAVRMAQALLGPTEGGLTLLRLATRRRKGTIVVSAVYGGVGSDPVNASWISDIRKAAASVSGGFHAQEAPDGGSEITITVPVLLPEKNGDE